MKSLRRRAIIAGIAWALLTLGLGSALMMWALNRSATARFDDDLRKRNLRVVAALGNNQATLDQLNRFLPDPDYQIPFSGTYWLVRGADGILMTSPSLLDTTLPAVEGSSGGAVLWTARGPRGQVRGITQEVRFDDGRLWQVTSAQSLALLNAEAEEMRRIALLSLSLLSLLIVAGAVVQTFAILSPLKRLREDVKSRWDGDAEMAPIDYPAEVMPLIKDINTLIQRNRDSIDRSRRQTSNLAHALNTPLAILRNEVESFGQRGVDVGDATVALERIEAQVSRSLVRIRSSSVDQAVLADPTQVKLSVDRLARLFATLPDTEEKAMTSSVPQDLAVFVNAQDLEEMLGTLLENAFKWCTTKVHLTAWQDEGFAILTIEDDGPGIPEELRDAALHAGQRLDTTKPGTGLGLGIVADITQTIGGSLALENSDTLGGLKVILSLPASRNVLTNSYG